MFLTSDAVRAFDVERLRAWDWSRTSILYVSHGWNPARDGAQAITGRRLVRTLLTAGAQVHVLAAARADDEESCVRYGLTVVPAAPLAANRIVRASHMVRSGIPEAAGRWVAPAVDAGMRLVPSLPRHTIVYGRASPGSSNIAAWQLARLTGLPWAAHFSDEWPPRSVLSRGRRWLAPYKAPLFARWRRRIVRDAGALTFSNPRQAREVLGSGARRYGHKAFVVAHLPSQLEPRGAPPQYDTFHIVHAGNFYTGQSPAPLLEGLRLFLDRHPAARATVRLTQAGWCDGGMRALASRYGLDDVVRLTGRLSESALLPVMDSASLLVVVDYERPDSTTVHSKIPDYLNARRPLLAITGGDTALRCLFDSDGAGLTAHYQRPSQIADRIGTVFEAWQRGQLDPFLPQPPALESYDWRRVLAELAAAFMMARERASPERVMYDPAVPEVRHARH